jgi:hypothetical protein
MHEFLGDGKYRDTPPRLRQISSILLGAALPSTAAKPSGNPANVLAILPHQHRTKREHKGLIPMRHDHSRGFHRVMNPEIADRLLESLRPTRHLLTRTLADIPIGGPEYRQVDRVVQEIDGLAKILIDDATHCYREGGSAQVPDIESPGE